jgi:hypothetical protein
MVIFTIPSFCKSQQETVQHLAVLTFYQSKPLIFRKFDNRILIETVKKVHMMLTETVVLFSLLIEVSILSVVYSANYDNGFRVLNGGVKISKLGDYLSKYLSLHVNICT